MNTREKIIASLPEAYRSCIRTNKEDDGTLIGLPHTFVVPSPAEKFQELYYWDTYFTNLGLIKLGMIELAKNNTDNILWLVEKYGFMPNGSRTYFLNRSQPPFLSLMVRDVFAETGNEEWLRSAYPTMKKEYAFWQTKRIFPSGLNGYTGYELLAEAAAEEYEGFVHRIKREPRGEEHFQPEYPMSAGEADSEMLKNICFAYRSFCESGWDCNSRFLDNGHNFIAVDLCSLLYGYEKNMRDFSEVLGIGEEGLWQERMDARRELMKNLWSEKENLYLDKNEKTGSFSTYRSLASVYPLFVGLASTEEAAKTAKFVESIELEYGFPCGENKNLWHCQWDYPRVWAPLQYITYVGLKNYGYDKLAQRVLEKFMKLVELNFEKNDMLWEKYTGTDGSIPIRTAKMYGWTAGVYTYFYNEPKG